MNFHQKTNQFESLESTLIILKMRLKYQELLIGSASIVFCSLDANTVLISDVTKLC